MLSCWLERVNLRFHATQNRIETNSPTKPAQFVKQITFCVFPEHMPLKALGHTRSTRYERHRSSVAVENLHGFWTVLSKDISGLTAADPKSRQILTWHLIDQL